jgi:hypothetical protein
VKIADTGFFADVDGVSGISFARFHGAILLRSEVLI